MKPSMIKLMMIFYFGLSLFGCSQLLYYPTDIMYVNPVRLKSKYENHEISLANGVRVQGWYFQSPIPQPKGVILFFHGNGQNRSAHYMSLFWIVKEGYDLAVFDYPGYGISDGIPTPQSTVEMGKAAIQYVHNMNPRLPLIVYGQSLGGNIAMRSVFEMKEKVKPQVLVVESSFLSYRAAARGILASSIWTWPLQPLAYLLLSDEWAIHDHVSELDEIPMIVIHSKQDKVISFSLGEEVYNKSRSKKEFLIRENGGHNETFVGKDGPTNKIQFLSILDRLTSTSQTETLLKVR